MVTVPRLWPGATVVCLASGPSLTAEDVAFVRGKARVIAVNDAVRLAPWADVLYSSDRYWWRRYRGMPSFVGLKFGLGEVMGKADPIPGCPDVAVLTHAGHDGVEPSPSGLRTCKNSGGAAINLAVHLGAARIVLLGYDMKHDRRQTHFFGDHPSGLSNASPYPLFLTKFQTMVEPLAAMGVSVINCSRRSALRCFPCRPLAEVFASVEVAA